jgi:hypothetical protein
MRAENTCQKFQVLPMRFLHRVPKGKKGSGHGRIAGARGKQKPHTKPRSHEEKKQNHGRQNHWEESQTGSVFIPSLCLRTSVRDSLPSGILCLSSKPMDIPIVLSQSYAGLLKHGGETLVLFLC